MITEPATARDFDRWQKQAKKLTESELIYTIDDCLKAAEAMATHPAPNREGYYRDQAATYRAELSKRQEEEKKKNPKMVFVAMVSCSGDPHDPRTPAVASASLETIENYLKKLPSHFSKENSFYARIELI
jgi:hypothetical protein